MIWDFLGFAWGYFQWVLLGCGLLFAAGGFVWLYRSANTYQHMIEPITRELCLSIGWLVYLVALGYSIGHWLEPVVKWFG